MIVPRFGPPQVHDLNSEDTSPYRAFKERPLRTPHILCKHPTSSPLSRDQNGSSQPGSHGAHNDSLRIPQLSPLRSNLEYRGLVRTVVSPETGLLERDEGACNISPSASYSPPDCVILLPPAVEIRRHSQVSYNKQVSYGSLCSTASQTDQSKLVVSNGVCSKM